MPITGTLLTKLHKSLRLVKLNSPKKKKETIIQVGIFYGFPDLNIRAHLLELSSPSDKRAA
uniref:Uncharacterized protein n=1 Tax=Anguilla anguilla TaxID=7936 RepID=A0A0E9WHF5_ANGAN